MKKNNWRVPPPKSVEEELRHEWWVWQGITCCKNCGVVKRADGTESRCRGKVSIGTRAENEKGPE